MLVLGPATGSLATLALTVALIFGRPRGLGEAWGAALGATIALLAGWAAPADVLDGVRDTYGVLLFLIAMMLLAALSEHAGVFHWAAGWTLLTARGRGWLLFVNIYLLGALITLLLSLDVTAIVLTPIVSALVVRLRLDARPFVFACAFVANTASLALPVSNLTNILVYDLLGVPFADFVRYLALPNVVTMAVNLALFLWLFWHRLPGAVEAHTSGYASLPDTPSFRWALSVLLATVASLLFAGLRGWPFWPAATAGAFVLAWAALARGWVTLAQLRAGVAWSLPPFVVGMYVVVAAVYHALEPALSRLPEQAAGLAGPLPLLAATGATAVGANLVNNLPLALAAIRLLRTVPPTAVTAAGANARATLAFAVLLGVNLGPNLTVCGSLATMLCLASARRQGIHLSPLAFLRTGLLVAPPMLLAAALTLWLLLRT